MIKIVYRDLSPGLHASAQVSGWHTVISLLPGLTLNQRRAALRRIRHSGRMGHGPRVPAIGLALAVGRDRIKATTRTGAAVVRLHPAGSTLPVVLLSAAAAVFVLMATVSIHVLPGPKSSDQNPVIGGVTPGPTSSAPRVSQSFAPSITVPGHSGRAGPGPERAGRRPARVRRPGGFQRAVPGGHVRGADRVRLGARPDRDRADHRHVRGIGERGGSGTGTSAGTGAAAAPAVRVRAVPARAAPARRPAPAARARAPGPRVARAPARVRHHVRVRRDRTPARAVPGPAPPGPGLGHGHRIGHRVGRDRHLRERQHRLGVRLVGWFGRRAVPNLLGVVQACVG